MTDLLDQITTWCGSPAFVAIIAIVAIVESDPLPPVAIERRTAGMQCVRSVVAAL